MHVTNQVRLWVSIQTIRTHPNHPLINLSTDQSFQPFSYLTFLTSFVSCLYLHSYCRSYSYPRTNCGVWRRELTSSIHYIHCYYSWCSSFRFRQFIAKSHKSMSSKCTFFVFSKVTSWQIYNLILPCESICVHCRLRPLLIIFFVVIIVRLTHLGLGSVWFHPTYV